MQPALSLEDAQKRILDALCVLPAQSVDLLASLGRVVSAPVVARRSLPAFSNSAMDGYALRSADAAEPHTRLTVTHTVQAGAASTHPVLPGTAQRIFTGAPVPQGADAVLMQEDAVRDGDALTCVKAPRAGQHIRCAGEDMLPGAQLLGAGARIGPGDIGAMAAQGICFVPVTRAPRVAIISTGDELVEIDMPPGAAQIANSNAMMLDAQVREAGGMAWRLPPVRDTPQALMEALAQAARGADIILTSGGVSVGDADFLRPVLEKIGALDFWRIAIKPGKPLAFGHVHGLPLLGLPGNPASSFVCFELFARPALRRLAGDAHAMRPKRRAQLTCAMAARGPRRELVRGALSRQNDTLWVTPLQKQGSGQLSSLLGADALIDCPAALAAQAVGADIDVWVLRPDF